MDVKYVPKFLGMCEKLDTAAVVDIMAMYVRSQPGELSGRQVFQMVFLA
jgi:hypothetical protein